MGFVRNIETPRALNQQWKQVRIISIIRKDMEFLSDRTIFLQIIQINMNKIGFKLQNQ